MRQVLGEVGGAAVPELVVINKADAADPIALDRLRRLEPRSVVVSARTGEGMDELREAIARELPRPRHPVDVVVPYGRGDLVSRMHADGEVDTEEHLAEGTHLCGRVGAALAGELEPYACTGS